MSEKLTEEDSDMSKREKVILSQSHAHPETQGTSESGLENARNQGTQLPTQKAVADAEALKAYLKYRAEHPEKLVVIDEMPHMPLYIDMREYLRK
ncbi:hypothetical protein C9A30_22040 [Salmonella enterica]|nr:hypothetical protein [Salmonella enterica]